VVPNPAAQSDWDNGWGVQIGVNATENKSEMGDKFAGYKTMTFKLSGTPSSGLRAMVHLKGEPDATTYCLDSIKSGVAMKLANFSTKCWPGDETTTVKVDESKLSSIDKVGLQVSGVQSGDITVTDLCLEQIDFGK
jgi:hypothetical protein